MKELLEDAQKIKSLEIQGASNVAISAIDFLNNYAKRLKCENIETCFKKLYEAQAILIDTRPTEPAMKNGLKYIMNKLELEKDSIIPKYISDIIEKLINIYLDKNMKKYVINMSSIFRFRIRID